MPILCANVRWTCAGYPVNRKVFTDVGAITGPGYSTVNQHGCFFKMVGRLYFNGAAGTARTQLLNAVTNNAGGEVPCNLQYNPARTPADIEPAAVAARAQPSHHVFEHVQRIGEATRTMAASVARPGLRRRHRRQNCPPCSARLHRPYHRSAQAAPHWSQRHRN